ncbi:hypothetical protein PISL3812_06157 [Talaromyces islandicus]|uniref:Barwin domain-containing protein n=1 Tax=Talaromyces islandicus TaxID=28573 RepID=A0A0U1M123_TALIS|nr:hypothetical protein PISL3812_06157 [Talaromyces islandicus]
MKLHTSLRSASLLSLVLQAATATAHSSTGHPDNIPDSYYHDEHSAEGLPYNLCDSCSCGEDWWAQGSCALFPDYYSSPNPVPSDVYPVVVPSSLMKKFGPENSTNPLCGHVMHLTGQNNVTVKAAITDTDTSGGFIMCYDLWELFGYDLNSPTYMDLSWKLIPNDTIGGND